MGLRQRLSRWHSLYVYNTPLGLMTTNEAIVFNIIAIVLVGFTLYWMVAILPFWLVHAAERLYYYVTGNSMTLGLMLLYILSRKYILPLHNVTSHD